MIPENTVILCRSLPLAYCLCRVFHSMGFSWSDGASYLDEHCWDEYADETCYNILEGYFAPHDFYYKSGYKIILAEDFLSSINVNIY